MQKNKNISSSLFLFLTSFIFCTNILGVNLEEHRYGLNVYKKETVWDAILGMVKVEDMVLQYL